MAVMNNRKRVTAPKPVTADVETEETTTVETLPPTQPTGGIDPTVQALLEQVKALSQEVQNLKDSDNKAMMFEKGRKINNDPKQFKYKLWGGVPVLSAQSKKKDNTKPYMYFTPKGEQISNQMLVLNLADGTQSEVEVTEFGQFHETSAFQVATIKTAPNGIQSYIFNTEQYGEIEVLSSVIN